MKPVGEAQRAARRAAMLGSVSLAASGSKGMANCWSPAMDRVLHLIASLGILSFMTWNEAFGEHASIVSMTTPRGVQQAFILIKPEHPVASVILFAGGSGLLRLNRTPPPQVGPYAFVAGNFLVRSRERFAEHDFMVAVIDAPSDQPRGMSGSFRLSNE